MQQLDVLTLLVVLAALVALGGSAIVLLWWQNRDEPGLGTFALACLAGTGSGLLAGTYGTWPELLSVLTGDVLTTLCFVGFLEGLRRFTGARRLSFLPFTVAGLHGTMSAYWTWGVPDPGARAILTTAIMVASCLAGTWVTARSARRRTRFGSGLLLVAMGGFSAVAVHHLTTLWRAEPVGLSISGVLAVGMVVCILLFLAGIFMTISERHVERLQQLRDAAEAGERSKARFLAVMSHEIRTPMNGVLGLSELLLGDQLDDRQRQLTLSIRSSGRILLRVLDDVLDLSKIEAGQLHIEESTFDLRELIGEVRQLVRAPAARKRLTLGVDIAAEVPETVLGDPIRIGQVLLNVIGNAIKFTESGGVILRLSTVERGIRCAVSDTGLGIDEEDLGRLFQPFQQMDTSVGRRFGGTGLGLAISKHLVTLMGGEIEVESTPGVGSTFTITLPLEASSEPPETEDVFLGELYFDETLSAGLPSTAPDPSSVRILVAEDDPVSQMVAEGMLTSLGVGCTLVSDGAAAVAALAGQRFDLVFMDCNMPKLDGLEATAQIRAALEDDLGPRLPIIALTAGVMADERQRCFAVGMDDVIAKPVSTEQLAQVLERWLQLSLQ